MTKSFTQQVEEMVGDTKEAMVGVVRASIGDVINQAQRAVAKGGRMPVKTGFLRASGRSSLTGWPTGPDRNDKKLPFKSSETYSDSSFVRVSLASLDIGDTFYFGWSADYALAINVRYGFLDTALQNWPSIVNKRAREAAKRMKK